MEWTTSPLLFLEKNDINCPASKAAKKKIDTTAQFFLKRMFNFKNNFQYSSWKKKLQWIRMNHEIACLHSRASAVQVVAFLWQIYSLYNLLCGFSTTKNSHKGLHVLYRGIYFQAEKVTNRMIQNQQQELLICILDSHLTNFLKINVCSQDQL